MFVFVFDREMPLWTCKLWSVTTVPSDELGWLPAAKAQCLCKEAQVMCAKQCCSRMLSLHIHTYQLVVVWASLVSMVLRRFNYDPTESSHSKRQWRTSWCISAYSQPPNLLCSNSLRSQTKEQEAPGRQSHQKHLNFIILAGKQFSFIYLKPVTFPTEVWRKVIEGKGMIWNCFLCEMRWGASSLEKTSGSWRKAGFSSEIQMGCILSWFCFVIVGLFFFNLRV